MASRVRPARRPRWRRYAPGGSLALLSILVILAPAQISDPIAGIGLGADGARIVLAGGAVLVGMLVAALVDRPPVLVLVIGATATSLGGNLASGPWIGAPMALAGLGWIGLIDARRHLEGVTLSPDGLTMHRPLGSPWTVEFEDLRAVHTSMHTGDVGTLILETEHGTVTAPHLPGCEALQARLEARMHRVPVRASADSLSEARGRLERLLEGHASV